MKRLFRAPPLILAAALVVFLPQERGFSEEKDEETYSISLVQTAESDKEIQEVEGRKVLTETYTVRKGDHLWQLFRERGLLEKRDLPELLEVLKRLNSTLANLDLIHPGEKIVIPLTLSPVKGLAAATPKEPAKPISLDDLKDLKLENYTVQPGDSLIKVVKARYGFSDQQVTEEYLEQLKRLNPEIADLNVIYPSQTVRLPVYTPQVLRAPIKPITKKAPQIEKAETATPPAEKGPTALSFQLKEIFTLMGQEWVDTGEHYIPLSSGGQINLKAGSFPIVNLSNGKSVIVDLHGELPERMAQVISSSWENYRVARLQELDDLRSALNKVFPLCEFHRLYRSGEPLELVSEIRLQITADWIVFPSPDRQGAKEPGILINLTDRPDARIPQELKGFLSSQGMRVIDFPPSSSPEPPSFAQAEVFKAGQDKGQLIETVLNLAGQPFTRNMEMPVHRDARSGFNLVVNADFFLYLEKKEAIIDFSGIGNEMIPLLKEYKISVLSLASESEPEIIVSRILEFIGVKFDATPPPFASSGNRESSTILLTIPGISFRDSRGQNVFASSVDLPDGVAGFLSRKGYRILNLALS